MKPDFGVSTLTKNCNETLILAVLAHGRKHGYQIALEIEEKSTGLFKFNHGTLYPILHKMEKEKIIKGAWKQEGPKRRRKYYTLTPAGKKYLAAQELGWRHFYTHLFRILEEGES
ncbi:MAG TPA: PadR family transcriptional regulator [bacterium]|nr:PadR family transcriptional regulator [bacterium]